MSAKSERRSQPSAATSNGYRSHTYYLSDELHQRIKAAWWATREKADGAPSLSVLVARLLEAESVRLEESRNSDRRFPPAPTSARGARSTHDSGHRSHTYYLSDVLHQRIKAAWWATKERPSLSTLVAEVMAAEASRLELTHNSGEPFPPAPRNARGVDPAASRRQGEFMASMWALSRDEAP